MYRIIIDCKSYDLQSYILSNTRLNAKADASECMKLYVVTGGDLNTFTNPGIYALRNGNEYFTNQPASSEISWSNLLVMYVEADVIAQLIIPYSTNQLCFRAGNPINNTSGRWNSWRVI